MLSLHKQRCTNVEIRQSQGIAAMKERGEWDKYGRPAAMDYKKFKEEYAKVVNGQIKPFELMKQLGYEEIYLL